MANPLLGRLDLDDVLVKFKLRDRYHAVTLTILSLVLFINFAWFCNHVFVAEKVGYRCMKHSLNPIEISDSVDINKTQDTTIAGCKNPALCSEWIYDEPDSFAAELACQDWKRTLVGSVHIFGYMVGVFTVGSLSDRFGRKTLAIITSVAGGLLGFTKSFVTSYWLYVALEFFEAAIGDPMLPTYTLAVEMVTTKSRAYYSSICMAGLGIGGIFFALTAWLLPYWRTMLKVMYAPGLLALSFIYLLDESPRWLLASGKKNKAVQLLTKAAKKNKTEIKDNLNTISCEMVQGPSFTTVITETFKSTSLLKRFFVCSIWWITSTFISYGLIFNATSLEGNKYLNFGLSATFKCLGIIISALIINKFNRRNPLILCFVVCAIVCTGQPFLPKNIIWLQVTNYMVGLLSSCASLNIIYIFTAELFPTQSRNTMQGLCSTVGRFGTIIAPQVPLLMVYWPGLPYLVFGAASLTAGLLTLLVRDTADRSLPDTVFQAEELEIKMLNKRQSGVYPHQNEC